MTTLFATRSSFSPGAGAHPDSRLDPSISGGFSIKVGGGSTGVPVEYVYLLSEGESVYLNGMSSADPVFVGMTYTSLVFPHFFKYVGSP